jgi:ketosteroid isomerase-like protein
MRTIICLPCALLLACIWPLRAQQTSVQDKALSKGESTSQKKPGIRVPTIRTEDELIKLEKQWAEAGVKGDIGFFARIAADDYLIVDTDGSVRNKQQEIANFHQETQTSQTVEDMKVRIYGGSAVVVGRFTITGTYAGQPNNFSGSFTDVWVWRNQGWQLVSTQNTSAPEADSSKLPLDSFFVTREKEVWEALRKKDKSVAAGLLAYDFVGMSDFGFSTNAEWIKQLDGQYTVDDYSIEDVKLLRPNPTTALLLYKSTCKGTGEWAEFCSRARYISDLWTERNGQWIALFSQDTQAK